MKKTPGGCQLLIHEAPLQVLPSLAVAIGLNEAIILQQLHYWLQRSERQMEGKPWVYNTVEQWHAQFPFWSIKTIRRTLYTLQTLGFIESTERFNKNSMDHTCWFTINYDKLDNLQQNQSGQNDQTSTQNDQTLDTDDEDNPQQIQCGQNDQTSGQNDQTLDTSDEWNLQQNQSGQNDHISGQNDHTPRDYIQRDLTEKLKPLPLYPPLGDGMPIDGEIIAGKSRPQPGYSPGFLRFWDCYPHARRVSKPSCFKTWKKAKLEPRTEEVCALITALLQTTWKEKPVNFIPTTMTWLNQGRYDDDLPVAATNPKEWDWVKEAEAQEARRATR